MSVYVFLGPTLPVEEARSILDAIYLPPVSMGDIYALMPKEPRVIAIIDGLFQREPAVWHKEILFALSKGVKVFGSSSMGALRAAELYSYGMEGVGRIFEAYRDGVLEDDDEVALIHATDEFDYRPISEAMVNIREGLKRARANDVISSETHQVLLRSAKEMFYPERSWPNLLECGRSLGLSDAQLVSLRSFVRGAAPNLKREDAIELLRRLASENSANTAPHSLNFYFEPTYFWLKMIEFEESANNRQRPEVHVFEEQTSLEKLCATNSE